LPKSSKISFIKIATISIGIFCSIVSLAFFTFSIAFVIKFFCLTFVITFSLSRFISFKLNISVIFSYNLSIPIFFNADIFIILPLNFFKFSLFSSIFAFKSILFKIIIAFLFLIKSITSKSSSSISFEASNIAIIKFAVLAVSLDFAIPIFSTSSFVSLIPAVSISFNGIPLIFTNSSIVSLVVPSYSVTIALSSFKIAFNKDDLPAFGFPIIAVFMPSFITFPLSKLLSSLSNFFFTLSNISVISAFATSSTSYSG